MNQAEARRVIWKRLAATARNDVDIGDWIAEEFPLEADQRRIVKASEQVADTIERTRLQQKRRR